ncbi:hypothetical protein GH714_040483 [Hevea brasiliensis]|uniref:Uncharacterized protein n=1 Tax=Hevea brasiliensis TaxID=3981 RepID=A0A6A6L7T9_HEVBR|nr:hypothetical protein GH714_040483 [Hevea brasiliensis]
MVESSCHIVRRSSKSLPKVAPRSLFVVYSVASEPVRAWSCPVEDGMEELLITLEDLSAQNITYSKRLVLNMLQALEEEKCLINRRPPYPDSAPPAHVFGELLEDPSIVQSQQQQRRRRGGQARQRESSHPSTMPITEALPHPIFYHPFDSFDARAQPPTQFPEAGPSISIPTFTEYL